MLAVTKDFAPPFSMVEPFFKIGSIFYALAMAGLLFLNPDGNHMSLDLVAWVHWFLLGFVMMVIFGAMAQLVPVALEVGHFSVDLYYVIWPTLLLGTVGMAYGFLYQPKVLPLGGMLVLISMSIFLFETFMTLRKVERITITVKSIFVSNLFLAIAVIIGFAMSLSIGLGFEVDVSKWLGAHVVLVLGGYITLTIIGLSMILLPMFGLSHGFDQTPVEVSFWMMTAGVALYLPATTFDSIGAKYTSLVIIALAIALYLYQVWIIYNTRARKAHDIYAKSMYVGYASLAFSLLLYVIVLLGWSQRVIMGASWFFIMGFVSFLIIGHLYKIVPFLVWFERFSPLVGKAQVPMLNEMLPDKQADLQFKLTTVGLVVSGIGVMFASRWIFIIGVLPLIAGGVLVFYNMRFMLSFDEIKIENSTEEKSDV